MASLQIISILCLFVCGAWLVSGQDEGCGSPLMEKYKSRLRLTYNYNVGCQELQEPRCKKYGYRETTEVNFLNHNSQFEARGQMSTFDHLIFSNCSAELEFFLCTFHFPICVADLDPVQPCRSMCHRVRDSCAPVLRAQGYEWPEAMSCELLPEQSTVCNGKAEACVNEVGPFNPEGSDIIPAVHLGGQQPIQEDQTEQTPTEQPSTTDNQVTPNSESQAPSLEECAASCQRYGVAQAQPKGTVWAFIGKVKNFRRLPNNKVEYRIKVLRPLRITSREMSVVTRFSRGSVVTVTVRASKNGCACPMFEKRGRYILTGRVGKNDDLRMRLGDGAVPYLGKRHDLTQILPKWLRFWMGIGIGI